MSVSFSKKATGAVDQWLAGAYQQFKNQEESVERLKACMHAIKAAVESQQLPDFSILAEALELLQQPEACQQALEEFACRVLNAEFISELDAGCLSSFLEMIEKEERLLDTQRAEYLDVFFKAFGLLIPTLVAKIEKRLQEIGDELTLICEQEVSGGHDSSSLQNRFQALQREVVYLNRQIIRLASLAHQMPESFFGFKEELIARAKSLLQISVCSLANETNDSIVCAPKGEVSSDMQVDSVGSEEPRMSAFRAEKIEFYAELAQRFTQVILYMKEKGYGKLDFINILQSQGDDSRFEREWSDLLAMTQSEMFQRPSYQANFMGQSKEVFAKLAQQAQGGDLTSQIDLLHCACAAYSTHFVSIQVMTARFNTRLQLLKLAFLTVPDFMESPPNERVYQWLGSLAAKDAYDLGNAAKLLGVKLEQELSDEDLTLEALASEFEKYQKLFLSLQSLYTIESSAQLLAFLEFLLNEFQFNYVTDNQELAGQFCQPVMRCQIQYVYISQADVFDRLITALFQFYENTQSQELGPEDLKKLLAPFLNEIETLLSKSQQIKEAGKNKNGSAFDLSSLGDALASQASSDLGNAFGRLSISGSQVDSMEVS